MSRWQPERKRSRKIIPLQEYTRLLAAERAGVAAEESRRAAEESSRAVQETQQRALQAAREQVVNLEKKLQAKQLELAAELKKNRSRNSTMAYLESGLHGALQSKQQSNQLHAKRTNELQQENRALQLQIQELQRQLAQQKLDSEQELMQQLKDALKKQQNELIQRHQLVSKEELEQQLNEALTKQQKELTQRHKSATEEELKRRLNAALKKQHNELTLNASQQLGRAIGLLAQTHTQELDELRKQINKLAVEVKKKSSSPTPPPQATTPPAPTPQRSKYMKTCLSDRSIRNHAAEVDAAMDSGKLSPAVKIASAAAVLVKLVKASGDPPLLSPPLSLSLSLYIYIYIYIYITHTNTQMFKFLRHPIVLTCSPRSRRPT